MGASDLKSNRLPRVHTRQDSATGSIAPSAPMKSAYAGPVWSSSNCPPDRPPMRRWPPEGCRIAGLDQPACPHSGSSSAGPNWPFAREADAPPASSTTTVPAIFGPLKSEVNTRVKFCRQFQDAMPGSRSSKPVSPDFAPPQWTTTRAPPLWLKARKRSARSQFSGRSYTKTAGSNGSPAPSNTGIVNSGKGATTQTVQGRSKLIQERHRQRPRQKESRCEESASTQQSPTPVPPPQTPVKHPACPQSPVARHARAKGTSTLNSPVT